MRIQWERTVPAFLKRNGKDRPCVPANLLPWRSGCTMAPEGWEVQTTAPGAAKRSRRSPASGKASTGR